MYYHVAFYQYFEYSFWLLWQVDVKTESDLKHMKDTLAAEKKKKKALLKSLDDVSRFGFPATKVSSTFFFYVNAS